jgi:hypothetical protein
MSTLEYDQSIEYNRLKYSSAEDYFSSSQVEKTHEELDAEDSLIELEFAKLYGDQRALYTQRYCDRPGRNIEIMSNNPLNNRSIDRSNSHEFQQNLSIGGYAFARRVLFASSPVNSKERFNERSNHKILNIIRGIEGVEPWCYAIEEYKEYYHPRFLKLLKSIKDNEDRILNQNTIANYIFHIIIYIMESKSNSKLTGIEKEELAELIGARKKKTQKFKFHLINFNIIGKRDPITENEALDYSLHNRILEKITPSIEELLLQKGLCKKDVMRRVMHIEEIYSIDRKLKGSEYDAEVFICIAIMSLLDENYGQPVDLSSFLREICECFELIERNRSINKLSKKVYMKLRIQIKAHPMLRELADRLTDRSSDRSMDQSIIRKSIDEIKEVINRSLKLIQSINETFSQVNETFEIDRVDEDLDQAEPLIDQATEECPVKLAIEAVQFIRSAVFQVAIKEPAERIKQTARSILSFIRPDRMIDRSTEDLDSPKRPINQLLDRSIKMIGQSVEKIKDVLKNCIINRFIQSAEQLNNFAGNFDRSMEDYIDDKNQSIEQHKQPIDQINLRKFEKPIETGGFKNGISSIS